MEYNKGMPQVYFKNRREAGIKLSQLLMPYVSENCIILGLARGGVEVACSTAAAFGTFCYPLVIKKIRSPWEKEFAIGALSDNYIYLNRDLIKRYKIKKSYLS